MNLNEVAPPTKKHERMVKHIKKAYKEDGKLTDKEKSIAYATAWKNYNEEVVDETLSFMKFRKKAEERKPKKAMDAGSRLRRKVQRREYADKVSGSEDRVPKELED